MFGLLYCKRLQLLSPIRKNVGDSTTHLCFLLHNIPNVIIKSLSSVESSRKCFHKQKGEEQRCSFTVSYLVNSCGLSLASAKSISKNINFDSPKRPDSVLNFLKNHGFANTHITKVVKSYPKVLKSNVEGILMPKLEFLGCIGLSSDDLVKVISSNPRILGYSLNSRLIPSYNFLKNTLLRDEMVLKVLKSQSRILYLDVQKFEENFKKVIGMGFDPSKSVFVKALAAISQMRNSTWEHKIEVYKRWGLSEDAILSAFKKHPICMSVSEKKIMLTMDFLVKKMGWEASAVSRVPSVFCYSLEKRIIPRCSVIRVLQSKGLIKDEIPVSSVLTSTEKYFLNTFVMKYQDQLPQLLDIFPGKMSVELGLKVGGKIWGKAIVL